MVKKKIYKPKLNKGFTFTGLKRSVAPEYDYLLKIPIIGDAGIGKSCLVLRIADDTFNTSYISTIGVDFKIITKEILGGLRIKTQIWDTATTTRYRHINYGGYYRGAHGIVLCYDTTDKRSFINLGNWIKQAENYAIEETYERIAIVGLKIDIVSKREVSSEEGLEFATLHGLSYYEVSSLSGDSAHAFFTQYITDLVMGTASLGNPDRLPDEKRICKIPQKTWLSSLFSKSISIK